MTIDGHEQRTFIPDDDSASKANWPARKPAKHTLKDKTPATDWLPAAIMLLCVVIFVVVEIVVG